MASAEVQSTRITELDMLAAASWGAALLLATLACADSQYRGLPAFMLPLLWTWVLARHGLYVVAGFVLARHEQLGFAFLYCAAASLFAWHGDEDRWRASFEITVGLATLVAGAFVHFRTARAGPPRGDTEALRQPPYEIPAMLVVAVLATGFPFYLHWAAPRYDLGVAEVYAYGPSVINLVTIVFVNAHLYRYLRKNLRKLSRVERAGYLAYATLAVTGLVAMVYKQP